MNNIQFTTNNLVQNSKEYKLIVYKFASQLYELSRYNQPVLILTTLVVLLVFTLSVYYLDSKKTKNQVETKDTIKKVDLTVNTNDISEENLNNTESNQNLLSNINSIKDEIIELRKELEILQYNKIPRNDCNCDEEQEAVEDDEEQQEAAEDNEDDEYINKTSNSDSDTSSTDEEKINYTKSNIQKLISTMSTTEIEAILQTCSNYVLIPNWYTKEDFSSLTNTKLSVRTWDKLLIDGGEYASLIDETNAMVVGWFENNVSHKIEKIQYNISSIENSDSESESDSDESSDSENDETKLLENDDTDEDEDEEDEDDDDGDEDEDGEGDEEENNKIVKKKSNIFIIKQLERLKYKQLKKIAGSTNNKLNKKELIELIAQDYKKYSILKALMFI